MFGSTTAPATGTTGGLFGSTAAAPSGGLFGGNTSTQAPGMGLFGSTQPQQQQQQQAGGLFGQQKPATGGLFSGSTLGASTLAGSTLGGSTLLGTSRAPVAPSPQQDAQAQFIQLAQRMEAITQAWNSNSPQCRFQVRFTCPVVIGCTLLMGSAALLLQPRGPYAGAPVWAPAKRVQRCIVAEGRPREPRS